MWLCSPVLWLFHRCRSPSHEFDINLNIIAITTTQTIPRDWDFVLGPDSCVSSSRFPATDSSTDTRPLAVSCKSAFRAHKEETLAALRHVLSIQVMPQCRFEHSGPSSHSQQQREICTRCSGVQTPFNPRDKATTLSLSTEGNQTTGK